MIGVLQGFAVVLGVILAGYLLAVSGIIKSEQRRVLNDASFYVATPALMFVVLQRSEPSVLLSPLTLVSTVAAFIAAGFYVVCSRIWFKRDRASTALGATASGYANAGNMGLPIAIYILGDAAYVAPVLLAQAALYNPLVLSMLEGTRNAKRPTSEGTRRHALRDLAVAVGRSFSSPLVIASVLGALCALLEIPIPGILFEPINMLSGAAIPLVLMVFGLSLHGQKPLTSRQDRAPALVASFAKLFVMPAATWLLCRALGLSPEITYAATIVGILPTAQNIYSFAEAYRRAEVQIRDTVFITTFASLPVIAIAALLLAP